MVVAPLRKIMYFSSRPVVNVEAHMSSQPMRINRDEHLLMSELRICFKIQENETSSLSKYSKKMSVGGSRT